MSLYTTFTPREKRFITGIYVDGRLMERNYKATVKEIGHTIYRECGDDLRNFSLKKTWTRWSCYLPAILTGTLIGYGCTLEHRNHMNVTLLLHLFQDFIGTHI